MLERVDALDDENVAGSQYPGVSRRNVVVGALAAAVLAGCSRSSSDLGRADDDSADGSGFVGYIDESLMSGGNPIVGMALVLAAIAAPKVADVEAQLRSVLLPGQNSYSFSGEGEKQRSAMLSELDSLSGDDVRVYGSFTSGVGKREQQSARDKSMESLLDAAKGDGLSFDELNVDNRGKAANTRDTAALVQLRPQDNGGETMVSFPYSHGTPGIWLADVVAYAIAAKYERGQTEFLNALGNLNLSVMAE